MEQEELDTVYTNFVDVYICEMKKYMKVVGATPKSKKLFKHKLKPYWSEELEQKWCIFHEAEKLYRKCPKQSPGYVDLRKRFIDSQNDFDKSLRCTKRSYNRRQIYELEKANVSNPTEFWKFIARLGPKTKKSIPWEVVMNDGNVLTEHSEELDARIEAFHSLLTPSMEQTREQQRHRDNIEESNRSRKESLLNHPEEINESINTDFNKEEVQKIVLGSKNGKAPGYDGLINEVFKNETSINLLVSLFNLCLRTHRTPSLWAKGVINLIPKSATNDQRVPLNYCGISLLPVTSKLYTAALSLRLLKYLESNNILDTEQNGFRPNRSCLDHIYTLINLCQIRKDLKQDTYLSFKKPLI